MDKFDFVIDEFENDDGQIFKIRVNCTVDTYNDFEINIDSVDEWIEYPRWWLEYSEDEWFKHNAWLLEKAEAEYKKILEELA